MTLQSRAPWLAGNVQADQRATRAVVDLDTLERNVRILRSKLSPTAQMMAVVKANAYGHGAAMIGQAAIAAGADRLGVATVREGLQLRARGIRAPILVLSPAAAAEVSLAVEHDLELTIGTEKLFDAIVSASDRAAHPIGIHVKVDSGMHRHGADPRLAVVLAQQVSQHTALKLAGLMTHFASADEHHSRFTDEQTTIFNQCLAQLTELGVTPALRHAANSAAALRGSNLHYDLVRFGIAMYGLQPSSTIALPDGVRPAMTVHSTIGRVFRLRPGDRVGYGCTYTAEREERAALIPIGYGDGYRRGLSDRTWMSVAGQPAAVIGRVSMDQTVVRLPDSIGADVGDDVIVFGGDPTNGAPSANQLADALDSISYEIVTGISPRVPRHYVRGGQVIATESLPLVQ